MESFADKLKFCSYGLHFVTFGTIIGLWAAYPVPTPITIVPAILIGLASFSTVKNRPIPIFVAFGLLTAIAFWYAVSAIRLQAYVGVFPPLILIAGIAWQLQTPNWTSFLFAVVSGLMMLGLLVVEYNFRFQNDYASPQEVVRSVIILASILVLGLLQAFVGFGLVLVRPKTRTRKSSTRKIVVPTGD